MILIRRIYDAQPVRRGPQFLVDRLWPRGIRKEDLQLNRWLKEVAPSTELRRWFSHEPVKWHDFRRRYFGELNRSPETWEPLLNAARRGDVTLLYSARDTKHNNAVALKEFLDARLHAHDEHALHAHASGNWGAGIP